MDIPYDQLASSLDLNQSSDSLCTIKENSAPPSKTPVSPTQKDLELKAKTEEQFGKLEANIGKAYDAFEASSSVWGLKLGGLFQNVYKTGGEALGKTKQDLARLSKQLEDNLKVEGDNSTTTDATRDINALDSNTENKEPLKKQRKMLEIIGARTQQYFDELDEDLEAVEKGLGKYVTRIGTNLSTILKENIQITGSDESKSLSTSKNTETEGKRSLLLLTNRLEAQLHALHTSTEAFITAAPDNNYDDFAANFLVDEHTDEISNDLRIYPSLRDLMSSVVPTKITYAEFWTRYYFMRGKIEEEDEKRKLLLQEASLKTPDDEKEFKWSDDEDSDDEGSSRKDKDDDKVTPKRKDLLNVKENNKESKSESVSSRSSSEVTYELESTNSSMLDIVSKHRQPDGVVPVPSNPTTTENSSDDDEDEDWE